MRLTVLMPTYNGARFIAKQVESLATQTSDRIDLIASDDGSSDGTPDALRAACADHDTIHLTLMDGPGAGMMENIRMLVATADPAGELVAFSDQDDIWLADKTARAGAWLSEQPHGRPALYCGRTLSLSEDGATLGALSPRFDKPPAFRNALVQSLAGGNTMTLNRAAFDLLKESLSRGTPVIHDWWAYLMVTGSGGAVHYDPVPLVHYRQHGNNQIGANDSLAARAKRLNLMATGRFERWTDVNLGLLRRCADLLTDEANDLIHQFDTLRAASLPGRLSGLKRLGLYRQTARGQALLWLAAALKRL